MIKHIVMWQVKEHEIHGSKEEVISKMKVALEGLKGKIEGLLEIEVGGNFNTTDSAYDVVLYSTFTNKEALVGYQNHPLHVAIGQELVRQVAINRAVVDYEV
nr:Dabb family protein [uncultured Cellulosilyticum sp.]